MALAVGLPSNRKRRIGRSSISIYHLTMRDIQAKFKLSFDLSTDKYDSLNSTFIFERYYIKNEKKKRWDGSVLTI